MTEQVTKVKNEGRVAAGKRLVEWNRKQKENLVKNRKQVASSGDSSVPSAQQEPQSHHTVVYGSGALAVLVVGVSVALYLYRGKIASRLSMSTSDSTPSKAPPAPEHDIFRMN